MDVMGAHTIRSGREGVIQFKSVLTPCMPIATCAVQPDQLGASPAAEVTLAPINISIKTDNFDFSGDTLVANATDTSATRSVASDISSYLTDAQTELDIDGNGEVGALTDGLLLIRYLFDFRGESLTPVMQWMLMQPERLPQRLRLTSKLGFQLGA